MKGKTMTSLTKIELEARIEKAVDAGILSFWERVVEDFPEITGGEYDPMYEGIMWAQATEWLEHWLSLNGKDLYV